MDPRKTPHGKNTGGIGQYSVSAQPAAGSAISTEKYFKGHLTASLYDRAERIALAVHVVTSHVRDQHSVVERLNGRVHYVLDELLKSDIVRNEAALWRITAELRGLVTDIELLKFSGGIPANIAMLIIQATDDMASLMRAASQGISSTALISESFFESRPVPRQSLRQSVPQPKNNGGNAAHPVTSTAPVSRTAAISGGSGIRNTSMHQSRRDRIIEILRSGPATVTEVASRMPDCGPKTVQRELATLVTERVIIAKGERRWRTYSVINPLD